MVDNVRGVEKDRATVNRDGGAQSVAWNSRLLESRQATLLYATHSAFRFPLLSFSDFTLPFIFIYMLFLLYYLFSFTRLFPSPL